MAQKIKMFTKKHHHKHKQAIERERKAAAKKDKLLEKRMSDNTVETMMKDIANVT